jgi:hypothetical protein
MTSRDDVDSNEICSQGKMDDILGDIASRIEENEAKLVLLRSDMSQLRAALLGRNDDRGKLVLMLDDVRAELRGALERVRLSSSGHELILSEVKLLWEVLDELKAHQKRQHSWGGPFRWLRRRRQLD